MTHGSGFSVQTTDLAAQRKLPDLLETMARPMRLNLAHRAKAAQGANYARPINRAVATHVCNRCTGELQ